MTFGYFGSLVTAGKTVKVPSRIGASPHEPPDRPMSSPQIQLALWVLQPMLQAAVALVVFRRKLHKDFPAFFAFTVAQVAIFAVEFPVYRWSRPEIYFDVYWVSAALNVIFAFKIIHEVF